MNQPRVVPWTTRSDLKAVRTGDAHELTITIKDQVRNEFYHFGEVEHFILEALRNPSSLESLADDIENHFGIKLSLPEINSYIKQLAKDNLLVARRFGDGSRLFQQANQANQNRWLQWATGLLSIRFRGFYPGYLLKLLALPGWLIFHPITLSIVMLAVASTTLFACLNVDSLIAKAPTFQQMAHPTVILLLLVGFIIAKVAHELGHGLACYRTGRECSEMGVMLLVGIPCMFCDVSDVWTEPSRWKRMFVSMAGIYVELIISTICFWGWFVSVDGNIHAALFGLMMVTSINTLFVNGNPLMRYDGYYTLSDALNIPNLAASASEKLQQTIRGIFVASEPTFNLNQPTRILMTYGVLASAYRVFIMFAIGWAAWSFFEFQQLRALGTVAVWMVAVLAVMPIAMSTRGLASAAWKEGPKLTNTTVLVVLLVLAYLCLASIEFTYRVQGTGQLELEKIQTEGELKEINIRIESLELSEDQNSAGQIAFWQQRKNSVQSRLNELILQQEKLTILSPTNGILVAEVLPESPVADVALISITGNHFLHRNRGVHVTRGELLGYVAQTDRFRGSVKVSETEIEHVQAGYPVELFVPYSTRSVKGTVVSVAAESREEDPGIDAPHSIGKVFSVEFECPADPEFRIGSQVDVAIICEPISPLGYLGRWWKTTFWF